MTKKETKSDINLNTAISELKEIAEWFEKQEDVDVEEGLTKIKNGATLVKACKERLKELENSFEEVKKELEASGLE